MKEIVALIERLRESYLAVYFEQSERAMKDLRVCEELVRRRRAAEGVGAEIEGGCAS